VGLSLLELRTHLSRKGRDVLVDLAVLVSFIWPHKEKISQKKRMKYLEEDNIIVRI
jgi:hypothetical protein